MAIVQVSRITARKGLMDDLPQPLAGAELGWAVDERRLFIGNGDLAEGAPTVGNTEILTQYSDLLSLSGAYTYQGAAAGYTVQTGPTGGDPVSQSLQSRLDSVVVVTDFGAVGDGLTDCTAAINRALFQLYCRDVNPAIRRSLFFPAGVYLVSDTIKIPPYALLHGEGANSSIIRFSALPWSSSPAWPADVLVKDNSIYYRSLTAVPPGISIANTDYWQLATLPECAARTTDNLQQTAANIGSNGAIRPQWVGLLNMSLATTEIQHGLLLEQCTDVVVNNTYFMGPLTLSDLTTAADDICAVQYESTSTNVVKNVSFNESYFSGFTYGTNTDQEVRSVTYNECDFDGLFRGVILGGAAPSNGGPTGVRINNCSFDNIYKQGVYIENVSNNITAHNNFYDVGNHFNGLGTPATSVMYFDAWNNLSIGDMFVRNDTDAALYPRIEIVNNNTVAVSMNSVGIEYYLANTAISYNSNNLNLGAYSIGAGIQDVLANDATATLAVIDKAYLKSFKIDYSIMRGDLVKTGEILVVGGQGTTTTGFSDDQTRYVENGDPGVTFNLSDSGTAVTFGYTTTDTVAGTIRYTISSFGA